MPAPAPSTPSRVSSRRQRLASIASAVRLMKAPDAPSTDKSASDRHLVADLCKIIGDRLGRDSRPPPRARPFGNGQPAAADEVPLSPRMRQTLDRLLAGDSEKEIAARLRLSPHTIHVYVKTLYRRFGVCSRGELFAIFVRLAPQT